MKIKLNKAIRSSGTRSRSRRTLSSTPGSRAIGGNAYRWSLGHICVIASSPRRAGCVRRTRVGSETSLETQTDPLVPGRTPSISAPPPRGGASIPRALSPCLDRMSAPIFWAPGMQVARIDNNFLWDHRRIWHASLQSGRDRKPPWWFM